MPGCAKAALHPGARHFVFDVRRNKVQRKPPRPEGEAWRDETGTSHPVPVFFSHHHKLHSVSDKLYEALIKLINSGFCLIPHREFPSLWEGLRKGLRRILFLFLKEASILTSKTQMHLH